MLKPDAERWSTLDAAEVYEVARWSQGYFSIGASGDLLVHPDRDPRHAVALKELIDCLGLQGIESPILFRFNGILKNRLSEIRGAFAKAIAEFGYGGNYWCTYPVKVNPQRQVVEQVVRHGREFGFGLEAGSKPELLAVIAITDERTPIICNGFKDAAFIETALLAQKIGRRVLIVVEKYTELELVLRYADRIGVRPEIGMRVKLASRGSGRWQSSGGRRSKFGLTIGEILRGLKELQQHEMADCFKLLHFHLGSQVTDIRYVKAALTEAARVYANLVKQGAGLELLDVGGGLGVDYDGSQTNFHSSVNYTLQEYANDVVYYVQNVCDDAGVHHPDIVSESGRSVAAYHSALVFNVLGVAEQGNGRVPQSVPDGSPQPLIDLLGTLQDLTVRNMLESYHDAQQAMDMSMSFFNTGNLTLDQRDVSESLFWAICRKIRKLTADLEFVPEELEGLDRLLSDIYFCNFSLFQSLPDSWAIKQLFPVMPIHRLDEEPTQHAVLSDITCDSDGKIDQFINRRDVRRTLQLHEVNGEPYYLGAFLIGAYQEILGDLHNLFGDTNTVNVDLTEDGEASFETVINGDTIGEVLSYVQFHDDDLVGRLKASVSDAVRGGLVSPEQADRFVEFYEDGLRGYTYLEQSETRVKSSGWR